MSPFMILILYKNQQINIYYNLKQGLFFDSSLTATLIRILYNLQKRGTHVKIQINFNIYASFDKKIKFSRYDTPGPQHNFLYHFRWTHSGIFYYYVSVTDLGYIWVYLDPFSPKSINLGDWVQTALDITIQLYRCYDEHESPSSCNTTVYLSWFLHPEQEEKFTGEENFFSAVNMNNCGSQNFRKHREIKGSDKYVSLDISLQFNSLDKMRITSSDSRDNLGRSGKGLITYLGLKAKVRPNR